jgi:hypothetical protein
MPKPAPAPETNRPAFLPAILAAAALLSGIPLIGADWYLLIRFIVAILALIVAWFAVQAGQWWWTIVFFVVATARGGSSPTSSRRACSPPRVPSSGCRCPRSRRRRSDADHERVSAGADDRETAKHP